MTRIDNARHIRAPRGTEISAKSWLTEAPLRMLNCASGATWVSIHHGGGVGIGYSQHAGMVIVCDCRDRGGKATVIAR